jgi:hypothetical protein
MGSVTWELRRSSGHMRLLKDVIESAKTLHRRCRRFPMQSRRLHIKPERDLAIRPSL